MKGIAKILKQVPSEKVYTCNAWGFGGRIGNNFKFADEVIYFRGIWSSRHSQSKFTEWSYESCELFGSLKTFKDEVLTAKFEYHNSDGIIHPFRTQGIWFTPTEGEIPDMLEELRVKFGKRIGVELRVRDFDVLKPFKNTITDEDLV